MCFARSEEVNESIEGASHQQTIFVPELLVRVRGGGRGRGRGGGRGEGRGGGGGGGGRGEGEGEGEGGGERGERGGCSYT